MQGVSATAVWVAKMRADEVTRPDQLHDDPFAAAFVAAATPANELPPIPPGASEFLALRTRFYDDYLLDARAAGVRQVVLLAAGLDSRAFRLDWPAGMRLFELDLPELLEFKESVLAGQHAEPRCDRVTVTADLHGDWATPLVSAGFDPARPTAWLAEGLLVYLTAADNDRLLTAIGRLSTPDSQLAFDHMDASATDRQAIRDTRYAIRDTRHH